jgi:ribosomal protein S18 acetylase RimI-like enzyme
MIEPVSNPRELREFIDLPYRLYRKDPVWVPPLRSEQAAQFDPCRNPMLNHCKVQLFLARRGGKVLGRVAAFIDRLALDHWQQPVGLFGSYECVEEPAVGHALLGAAVEWLREHSMSIMRGPWSFASQEWGMVVEGFIPPPVLMAPYNPPYYNQHLESFGLTKAKDLMVYYIDGRESAGAEAYRIPERYLKLTDRVQQKYGVKVRPVDMQHLEQEVLTIVRLANQSIADNWGYYPVTEEEGRAMARDLKQIVNPQALLIAEDPAGQPIGFAMSLPDINALLRGLGGRLFPLGWLKLLWGLPRLRQYRMWALGVVPEYQGKAIDTLLYRATYEALYKGQIRLEINYVLEDNLRMNNALQRLGVKPLRRYRVYQMDI